ncbi:MULTISPECIES: hypothetical protein [Oscillatoriales]|nr:MULTISPECIES: hypothetical protein [Oscillatoriales]
MSCFGEIAQTALQLGTPQETGANGIAEDNAAASAREKLYFDTTLKNK